MEPEPILHSQRILGLTGGIGTGKSTVGRILAAEGIRVIDADQLAREAVAPGSMILERIVQRFGSSFVDAAGQLNRRQLGARIFTHGDDRHWLENQIHPYVRQQLVEQCLSHSSVVCLMIPLLFEAAMTDLVTEIWVVQCPYDLQVQRLHDRDQLERADIEARIKSQWPLSRKCKLADVVIDNSGSLEQLRVQVLAQLKTN